MSWSTPATVVEGASVTNTPYASSSVDLGVITENYLVWAVVSSTDASLEGPLSFNFQGSVDNINWYGVSGGVAVVSDEEVSLPDYGAASVPVAPGTPVRYLRAVGGTLSGTMTGSAYYAVREEL
jgi:hypothetical protein